MNNFSPARCTWRIERASAPAVPMVVLAELAVPVRTLAVRGVVLLPQQLQGDAFALQLLMDAGKVRHRVLLARRALTKQQTLHLPLVQIGRQRPPQALLQRPLHVLRHGALGDPGRRRDPLVAQLRLEFQT